MDANGYSSISDTVRPPSQNEIYIEYLREHGLLTSQQKQRRTVKKAAAKKAPKSAEPQESWDVIRKRLLWQATESKETEEARIKSCAVEAFADRKKYQAQLRERLKKEAEEAAVRPPPKYLKGDAPYTRWTIFDLPGIVKYEVGPTGTAVRLLLYNEASPGQANAIRVMEDG